MAMNQRMMLKELADKFGRQPVYKFCSYGADHMLCFSASVTVCDAYGAVRYSGDSVATYATKKAAQEAAAADALQRAGGSGAGEGSLSARVRAKAWLGDSAFEFTLALLGSRSGLSVEQLDRISQRLFSNESLAAYAPEQLTSTTLTATSVEAAMGEQVADHLDTLLEILVPAMMLANQELTTALQDAVYDEE